MENNRARWAIIALLGVVSFAATASAFDGGTKMVVTMIQPEKGQTVAAPIFVSPRDQGMGTKTVAVMLNRFPVPTLSIQRIREEKRAVSLGTKAVVLFQKKR